MGEGVFFMADELRVSFIFDDKDGPKIDAINRKLTETNAQLNSLTADRAAAEFSKLTNAGQKSIDHMREFARAFSQETGKTTTDLSALQSRVEKTKFAFSDLAAQNLKAGNFGHLANEIAIARDRSRQLEMDIKSIKAELANPNRQSSIKFLMQELQAAEREADSLQRKLAIVQGRSAGAGGGFFGNNLTSHEYHSRINLARQGADVFTMAGMGASPQMIAITQGPQIVDAMATSGLKFSGAMIAGAAAIGTIAVAGYGIVQWTKSVRTEAEKRLKTETMITAEFNKQNLARKQAIQDFAQAENERKFGRQFARDLQNLDDDALRRRRDTFRRLRDLNPTGGSAALNDQYSAAIEDELARRAEERRKRADEAFFQRNENFKKYQNSVVALEQKSQADIEKGIEKVKELGRAWNSVFDNLNARTNQNNPFVAVFADSRSELDKLKESIRSLPDDLQAAAIASQQALNRNRLFETRLDNQLGIFDLQDTARRFRQGGETDGRSEDEYIRLLRASGIFEGNFGALNQRSAATFLANRRFAQENSAGERLRQQISIINSLTSTDSERAIADRRLLGLASGLDPSQLNQAEREQVALAAEREAERRAEYERKALENQTAQINLQSRIAAAQESLLEIVNSQGLEGLNNFLQITVKDETSGGISTGRSGTSEDVARNYLTGGF